MKLAGKTVLLTGATGGLGGAIARDLHAAAAKLVLTGRRSDVLEPLGRELGAQLITCDLSDPAALRSLGEQAGAVDILIANAGLPGSGRLLERSTDELDRVLDVNLRAPIMLTRALAPAMIERGGGQIVFISSLGGKAATPGTSMYNASKFGLRGFALAIRQELRDAGVGVSVISPGFVSEAGMFVDAGVKLPPGLGTVTPQRVAKAVRRAIERNRAEIDVAAAGVRAGARFAYFAPEVAARLSARLGTGAITDSFAAGQADKR
jgi:short-subunit dehydrogenase